MLPGPVDPVREANLFASGEAELVAFRICHHQPAVALVNAPEVGRSEADQARRLVIRIGRLKIEMKAILAVFRFGNGLEDDGNSNASLRLDLNELAATRADLLVAKRIAPEFHNREVGPTVDDDIMNRDVHSYAFPIGTSILSGTP